MDFNKKKRNHHSQIAMAKVGFPVRSTNRIIVVRAGFRAFFDTTMSKAAGRLDTFVICGFTNLSLDASLIAVRVATEVFALPIMQQLDFAARGAGYLFKKKKLLLSIRNKKMQYENMKQKNR